MAKRAYLEEMRYIIGNNESGNNYESINPREVVSIGIFNWYGARALGLARTIVTADPEGSRVALSGAQTPLYDQITSGNNNVWNNYIPGNSARDMAALRTFLGLPASHDRQDALATNDSISYSSQAKARGITDPAAQIYFSDLYNQSPKQAGNIVDSLRGQSLTLSNLHSAAMANPIMNKYTSRRNWTYEELLAWTDEPPPEEPPVTPPVNPPNNNGGGNIPPSEYGATDYILEKSGLLIHYSVNTPQGRLYYKRNNMYFPVSQIDNT